MTARGGPLAVANFRLLSIGQLASTVGDYCYAVALPWLVLSDHQSAAVLGAVLACYGVPRTVLIPLGGVLADKFSARTVMMTADAVRCVLVAALAVLAVRHVNSFVALAPVAALLGAGEGVFLPASFSIMPALLPSEQLGAANSIVSALMQLGSLGGPVLGGILVATVGAGPAFAIDAGSFAVSAIALGLIRTPRTDTASGATPAAAPDTREAGAPGIWQLLRQSVFLQIILVVCVVANFTSSGTFEVALPALAHASYGASGYSALLACYGVGALVGTVGAARMNALRKPTMIALIAYLVTAVAVALTPFLGGLPGAAAAMAVAGAFNGFGNLVLTTLIQQWAPAQLIGRLMSLLMLASFGTFPVSAALSGVLVRHVGATPFFPIAGLTLGVVMLFAMARADLRNFTARPASPAALPREEST